MAGYYKEHPDSGSTTWDRASSEYESVWIAHEYSSMELAKIAVASAVSSAVIVDGFTLSHRVVTGEPLVNPDTGTDTIFKITVNYSAADKDDGSNDSPGDLTFGFDVSGQSFTRTEALEQAGYGEVIAALVSANGGPINIDDGEAKGVEVIVPQATYTETHIFHPAAITIGWFRSCSQIVGKTNEFKFRGFDVEELLLTGLSGEQSGAGSWRVTFTWQVEWTTADEYYLNGVKTAVTKPGHRYIWFYYAKAENAEAGAKKVLVPKAMSAYVAKVYDTADYGVFGI